MNAMNVENFVTPPTKSPLRLPLGPLMIDLAGLKGLNFGPVLISPEHGNYLVNRGGASELIAQLEAFVPDDRPHPPAWLPPDVADVTATQREVRRILAATLRETAAAGTCIIVECLTLWLSNLLFRGSGAAQAEAGLTFDCPLFNDQAAGLIAALPQLPGTVILVSNEVGWGIVPMHPVSRIFADEQGRLNQRVAAVCDQVTLVAAGLPLKLKG